MSIKIITRVNINDLAVDNVDILADFLEKNINYFTLSDSKGNFSKIIQVSDLDNYLENSNTKESDLLLFSQFTKICREKAIDEVIIKSKYIK